MIGFQDCFTNSLENVYNAITTVSNRLSALISTLIPINNLPVYLQEFTFSSGNILTSVYFNIVGGIPTSTKYGRTWNLVMAGQCPADTMMITFTYDFSNVISSYLVSLDYNVPVTGTLNFNGVVYDASLYFGTPTLVNNILTLPLDMSSMPMSSTLNGDISYNIWLADYVQAK